MVSGISYFRVWDNILQSMIIIFAASYLGIAFFHMIPARHLATWAVFLGWLELTLLIGRFPSIGIYIYMSFMVIKTLVLFTFIFLPVLAAYAFAFYIIHPHAEVFDNPLTSFLKIIVMMVGEYNLENYFIWKAVKEVPFNFYIYRRFSCRCRVDLS